MAGLRPEHFEWHMEGRVAVIRLMRPERKNPLTFDSYAELRDTFRDMVYAEDVDAVVLPPMAAISAPVAMCTTLSARCSTAT